MTDQPPLRMPGATLATRLKVYDTPSPDGLPGGTPHVHLLCTELYFVTQGAGYVEMIDHHGYAKHELNRYDALLFSPGTLHRLVTPSKDLELFIVMQNSGLPERGDNVVVFPASIMTDQVLYDAAMQAPDVAAAQRRRDLGVEGFNDIKAAFEASQARGRETLNAFYKAARERTETRLQAWRAILEEGPLAEARLALDRLDALERGDTDYLAESQQHPIPAEPFSSAGFCGTLNRYFDPATLLPEGETQP